MSFINPDQTTFLVETNGVQFGAGGSSVSTTLQLDQTVVGTNPTNTITPPVAAPFTTAITNGPIPVVTLTMTGTPVLGSIYDVTINSGGSSDTLHVKFLLSQTYNPTDWSNSNVEENVSGLYKLQQIAQGGPITSTIVNTKLKSLLEFISLVNAKLTNFLAVYRIKKNLPDIINAAIFAGAIPAGYNGTVTYGTGTPVPAHAIDHIILQDTSVSDADSFTKITFNYVTLPKTITPSGGTDIITNYQVLDSISVDRVASASSAIQYNIATVTITRVQTTFTSQVDPSFTIKMPLVQSWTVTG